ncbi:hypothetical protein DFJ73DRAFT_840200 [Zopfochytrium polystomum]|nr:hypothetical protein DFJ73DRAFT_840200 [Zopfochytrium polystomum]
MTRHPRFADQEGNGDKPSGDGTTSETPRPQASALRADDTTPSSTATQCSVCHTRPIEYAAVPCGCHVLCKSCGMKQATGGKCKLCGSLFGGLRRI